MDIHCPHCGTEYEIEQSEYGRFTRCQVCGKGFVIGEAPSPRDGLNRFFENLSKGFRSMLKSLINIAVTFLFVVIIASIVGESDVADDDGIATLRDTLANFRERYNAKLERYDLAEVYFDETHGVCNLILLDIDSLTEYHITYYRSDKRIAYSETMPMHVAEAIMGDRLAIQKYDSMLANDGTSHNDKKANPDKPKQFATVAKTNPKPTDKYIRKGIRANSVLGHEIRLYIVARYKVEQGYILTAEEEDILRRAEKLRLMADRARAKEDAAAAAGLDELSVDETHSLGAWMDWLAVVYPKSHYAAINRMFEESTGISSTPDDTQSLLPE